MISTTPQIIEATAGINWNMWISLVANLVALAYGYGILNSRVKGLEKDHDEHRAHRDKTDDEIFARLRKIEAVTPRLEDAAGRLEKIVGNGLSTKIDDLHTRLAKLEQHCADVHGKPPNST